MGIVTICIAISVVLLSIGIKVRRRSFWRW